MNACVPYLGYSLWSQGPASSQKTMHSVSALITCLSVASISAAPIDHRPSLQEQVAEPEPDDKVEEARRGGGALMTSGSFTMGSAGNSWGDPGSEVGSTWGDFTQCFRGRLDRQWHFTKPTAVPAAAARGTGAPAQRPGVL